MFLRSFGFDPFLGRDVDFVVDILDFPSSFFGSSLGHVLEFDVFFHDFGLSSEEGDGGTFLDGVVGVQESVDDGGFVTESHSDSLSDFLDADDLNK
jgi:hypothetical protein